jgi:type IV pilus assembly protein PilB
MGIEPFLVASSIEAVVAQRLARTLCSFCRTEAKITRATLTAHGFTVGTGITAFEAVGCRRCGGSGYKGRTGLYETMPVTDEIRSLVIQRASTASLRALAIEQGMRLLRDDGLDKIKQGITTVEEVVRVTGTN